MNDWYLLAKFLYSYMARGMYVSQGSIDVKTGEYIQSPYNKEVEEFADIGEVDMDATSMPRRERAKKARKLY